MRIIFTLLALGFFLQAQAQLVITPGNNWTDATLYQSTKPGNEASVNNNYRTYPRLIAAAWTDSGYPNYYRSLMRFNVSSIAPGTTITSAYLYFYSDPAVSSGSAWNGNSQASGSNAFFLEKVTQNWSETTVTWSNQPTTTTTGRVWVGPSSSTTENIRVDITGFVQSWVNNPAQNYGLKMLLETELKSRSRNYGSEDHSKAEVRPMLVIEYQEPRESVKAESDHILAPLNKSFIPSGILYDRVAGMSALEKYDGSTNTVASSSDHFFQSYFDLYEANYNNSALQTVASLHQAADIHNSAGRIPLGVLYYQMHVLDSMADENRLIEVRNGQAYDVAGRTTSPYISRTVLVGAPLLARSAKMVSTGSRTFILDPAMFKTNRGVTLQHADVNLGDGSGVRRIYPNGTLTANYTTPGIKNIDMTVSFSNGQVLNTKAHLDVRSISTPASVNDPYCSYVVSDTLMEKGAPFDVSQYIPSLGQNGNQRAWVTAHFYFSKRSCSDRKLRKPIIFLDGFDPANSRNHEDIYQDYINDINDNNKNINLGEKFRSSGYDYDIVIVDYKDGGDFIEKNGLAVIALLQRLYQIHGATMEQDFVVIGPSMGALVGQYALAEAERRGINLRTRLYISFDGPHQGANIPIGLQQAAGYVLKNEKLFEPKYDCKTGTYSEAFHEDQFPLNVPSAKQMLIHHYKSGSELPAPHYYRHIFTRTMATLGYPRNSRKVAIVNGSSNATYQQALPVPPGSPQNQAPTPGALLLYANSSISWPIWGAPRSDIFRWKIFAAPSSGRGKTLDAYIWKPVVKKLGLQKNYEKYALPAPGGYSLDVIPGGYSKTLGLIVEGFRGADPIDINLCSAHIPRVSYGDWGYEFSIIAKFFSISPSSVVDVNTSIPQHNFIHTTSAVDLRHPSGHLYTYNFSNQNLACLNYTPFNRIYAPLENQDHVAITHENAKWFEYEIVGTPNLAVTRTSATVSGSNTICTQESYTVSGFPTGSISIFSWDKSPDLTITSGQGTSTLTVAATSSTGNNSWVEVKLTDNCGVSYAPIRKYISKGGAPSNAGVSIYHSPSEICQGQTVYFFVDPVQGVTNYRWVIPSGWTYLGGQGTRYLDVQAPASGGAGGSFALFLSNSCGETATPVTKYVSVSYCYFAYYVYPNPSTSEFTIEPTSSNESTSVDQQTEASEFEYYLYDAQGTLKKNEKAKDGKNARVNVKGMKPGLYHLIIKAGDKSEQHHIQIN